MDLRGATLLLTATVLVGCNSISSTMLNRLETDDFVGNSNGKLDSHCSAQPYKGVPITLRVPTHVDVSIQEKVRFCLNGDNLTPLKSTRRHLSVETDLIYTDKVFTVDVKRPAAGSADYTLEFGDKGTEFDNRQYFKNIKSKIVDETIQDVTAAINTVFSAVPSSRDGDDRQGALAEDGLVFFDQTRTVAWKRFDVDMVDFEMQVAAFVQQHLNDCNSCLDYRAGADGVPADGVPADRVPADRVPADRVPAEQNATSNINVSSIEGFSPESIPSGLLDQEAVFDQSDIDFAD